MVRTRRRVHVRRESERDADRLVVELLLGGLAAVDGVPGDDRRRRAVEHRGRRPPVEADAALLDDRHDVERAVGRNARDDHGDRREVRDALLVARRRDGVPQEDVPEPLLAIERDERVAHDEIGARRRRVEVPRRELGDRLGAAAEELLVALARGRVRGRRRGALALADALDLADHRHLREVRERRAGVRDGGIRKAQDDVGALLRDAHGLDARGEDEKRRRGWQLAAASREKNKKGESREDFFERGNARRRHIPATSGARPLNHSKKISILFSRCTYSTKRERSRSRTRLARARST